MVFSESCSKLYEILEVPKIVILTFFTKKSILCLMHSGRPQRVSGVFGSHGVAPRGPESVKTCFMKLRKDRLGSPEHLSSLCSFRSSPRADVQPLIDTAPLLSSRVDLPDQSLSNHLPPVRVFTLLPPAGLGGRGESPWISDRISLPLDPPHWPQNPDLLK